MKGEEGGFRSPKYYTVLRIHYIDDWRCDNYQELQSFEETFIHGWNANYCVTALKGFPNYLQMVILSSGDSSLCVVCSKTKASYKCPKCRSVYCSLGCNKAHKLVCHSAIRLPSSVNEDAAQPLAVASQTLDLIAVTSEVEMRYETMGSHDSMVGDTEVENSENEIETTFAKHTDNDITTKLFENDNIESNSHVISEISVPNIKNKINLDETDFSVSSVSEAIKTVAEPDIAKCSSTEGTSSTATSRRINHNIDSHDMEILSSKSVQCLLQSEWAKKLLKSSRLRDDILSVDSASNRQGKHCVEHNSFYVFCKTFF